MSIINEALKKAEEESQRRKEKSKEFVSTQPEPQELKKEASLKRSLIAKFFLLGILCITAIAISLTSIKKKTTYPPVSADKPPQITKTGEQALSVKGEDLPAPADADSSPSPPVPAHPRPPEGQGRRGKVRKASLPFLSLEGIVWDEKKPLALINNKILSEGDVVREAKIVKISKKEVKLIFQGREFTLRVH
jgi:hypothetical protein